jgi:phosphoribosylglycinamide formyltransferase-1
MKHTALGVLASGRGSNLKALLDARARGELSVPIAVVVSDNPEARALALAREAGVPALALPTGKFRTRLSEEAEAEWVRVLRDHGVDLVALAGFLRVLHAGFLDAFPGAIVNIHPSLLPAFPGLESPRQALEWGVRWAGCTAHLVTAGVDAGPILEQAAVPVRPDDTAETVAARILVEEHRIFPMAVDRVARGDYRIEGRRVVPLAAPDTGIVGPPVTGAPPPPPSRSTEGEAT